MKVRSGEAKSSRRRSRKPFAKTSIKKVQKRKQAKKVEKKRPVTLRGKKGTAQSPRKVSRSYSDTSLKKLWGLSRNECAFPGCPHELIAAETPVSDEAIVGYICHIYAAADNGPRGKPGLTGKERNAFSNLILMCGYHHPLVDKQHETYSASDLFRWKKDHEAKAKKGTAEAIEREADIQKHAFIEQMSDEQIEYALQRVRRARYLIGFPTEREARSLATNVEQSKYSGGSGEVRAQALAWCARFLALRDAKRASELLSRSKELAVTPEATLAQAFITAQTDKDAALLELSRLNSTAARSAALRIVSNAEGAEGSLRWVKQAGLTLESFDAEGKFAFISNALFSGDWDAAINAIPHIEEADFEDFPVLMHAVALANLITAVPSELRTMAVTQVPFESQEFLLGSSAEQLAARRRARLLFERTSAFARKVGATQASNLASDYALWLRLRDLDEHADAMAELRESMRDPSASLRRLNLALQFGVKVDLAATESRIDQSMALTGKGTPDDAFARFSLAFAQGSHKGVADYIEKHRAQLYEHLSKLTIQSLEIEVLARAGLVSSAREKLSDAIRDGLSKRDQEFLNRIIAEAEGADPIAERRALYESTGELRALVNLADALEKAGLWQDLLPFAVKLLAESGSVEACERVARCLDLLSRYGELHDFLASREGLVRQSENLKFLWAWTLYREGQFSQARKALLNVTNRDCANARALQVNIAVASGEWDKLIEYSNDLWANRDEHSAHELLHAAQLSIAVNAPHSRDLIIAAAHKEPGNPEVLAAAYFQATAAGWEQNETVGGWLNRAAQLSGDNGPLKSVTLKELVEQKPEWDRQAANIWDQLRAGRFPSFGAAQLLNRSLLELYLLPSLANTVEVDSRKRNIIFAYSGARTPLAIKRPRSIALDLAAIVTFARLGLLEKVVSVFETIIPHSTLGWLFQEKQKATFHQPSRIKDARQIKHLIASGGLHVLRLEPSSDHNLAREVGSDLASLLSAAKSKNAAGHKVLVVKSADIHRLGSLAEETANIAGYDEAICSSLAVLDRLKSKGALTLPEEEKARAFLKLQEKSWPTEATIDDDTELYLDEVTVSHLQTAGLLGKFKLGQIKAYIPAKEDDDANQLLAIESLADEQLAIIEQIRSVLAASMASGRTRAVRTLKAEEDDKLFKLHPTYGVLGLAESADAIVVDDRFINHHPHMTFEKHTTPILCSLDILDQLYAVGELSSVELYAHRTTLRQAGYQLIAVTDDELRYHLKNCRVVNGALEETAELKAIRESLLRARMSKIVQIPLEAQFLHQSLGSIIRAMKEKWVTLASREEAKAYSDYLLAQADIRGWATSALPGNERGFALFAYGTYALQIISPPLNANAATQSAYYEWISDVFLKPIKEYQPEVYQFIVERSKELAISSAEEAAAEYEQGHGKAAKH
ncbi:MAG TPA: hypothetical protein VNH44_09240 [Micropepsaceae bacterium]|nr:hypothetical protein [Micropepsaceae bacterium]